MSGVLEGLAAEVMWNGGVGLFGRALGHGIKITSPRPLETLTEPQSRGGSVSFAVRGTLKRLPKGHVIWLITQDERSGRIWPQGFEAVQFDPFKGEWFGRVIDIRTKTTKIIAVVAPPTSHDFFTYYQEWGAKTEWKPLNRVPPECRNRAEVQAKVP